ncbi:MAG: hypothetical protein ACI9NC_005778, partial [Verrucomicrobiales bacterium]
VTTGTIIPAGGFLLITGFENGTGLDNNGETITLLAADDSVIEIFRYEDGGAWPNSPDGDGTSLTRILPPSDPNLPTSWRPSVASGGSPESSDAVVFTGDPDADDDMDGLNTLLEHATGSSDQIPTPKSRLSGFSVNADILTVALRRNLAADDIVWSLEQSTDLNTWTQIDTEFEDAGDYGDGTGSIEFKLSLPDAPRYFWRARIVLTP